MKLKWHHLRSRLTSDSGITSGHQLEEGSRNSFKDVNILKKLFSKAPDGVEEGEEVRKYHWSREMKELRLYCEQRVAYRKSMINLIIFFAYLVLFFYLKTLHIDNAVNFRAADTLREVFLDEEFEGASYKKNYYEVRSFEEVYDFLEGPLLNGLYPTKWYNGENRTDYEQKLIGYQLELIGTPRIRQARVREELCHFDRPCYPVFSQGKESLESYGPDDKFTAKTDLGALWGYEFHFERLGPINYGHHGFVQYLAPPGDPDDVAPKILADMKAEKWIDRATAAIAIHFTCYSPGEDLIVWNEFLLEIWPSTGHIQPEYSLRGFKRNAGLEGIRNLFMVLTCIYICNFFYNWYMDVKTRREKLMEETEGKVKKVNPFVFLFDTWNFLDAVNLALFLTTCVLWKVENQILDDLNFDANNIAFKDFTRLAFYIRYENDLSGANIIMSCVKIFKHFRQNFRMSLVWNTIARAMTDLVVLAIVFLILMTGFAWAGSLIFGHLVWDFRDPLSSFGALCRALLGDMDYPSMAVADRRIAPIFMLCFVALMTIVVLNLFIAVIVEAFEDAQDDWEDNRSFFQIGHHSLLGVRLKTGFRKRFMRVVMAAKHLRQNVNKLGPVEAFRTAVSEANEESAEGQILTVFEHVERYVAGSDEKCRDTEYLERKFHEFLEDDATAERKTKMRMLVALALHHTRIQASQADPNRRTSMFDVVKAAAAKHAVDTEKDIEMSSIPVPLDNPENVDRADPDNPRSSTGRQISTWDPHSHASVSLASVDPKLVAAFNRTVGGPKASKAKLTRGISEEDGPALGTSSRTLSPPKARQPKSTPDLSNKVDNIESQVSELCTIVRQMSKDLHSKNSEGPTK